MAVARAFFATRCAHLTAIAVTFFSYKITIATFTALTDVSCVTLDSDIVKEIKDMAEKDDRSFSQYINKVLKEYVNSKKDNK